MDYSAGGANGRPPRFHPHTAGNQRTGTLGEFLPDNANTNSFSVHVVQGMPSAVANNLPRVSVLKSEVRHRYGERLVKF